MNNENEVMQDDFLAPKRSVFFKVIACLVAFSLIILSFQAYFYLLHSEPVEIPKLTEIKPFLDQELETPFSSHDPEEVKQVVLSIQDNIKQVANFIAAKSCRESDSVCQSKALFYFVRDEIDYVADDNFHDQLENPLTVLKTGGADCEDMAVLLIALEKAIGNKARLVFVPGHAYAQISISNYKGGKWINLEGTCKDCQFGELPTDTGLQKKEYFEI